MTSSVDAPASQPAACSAATSLQPHYVPPTPSLSIEQPHCSLISAIIATSLQPFSESSIIDSDSEHEQEVDNTRWCVPGTTPGSPGAWLTTIWGKRLPLITWDSGVEPKRWGDRWEEAESFKEAIQRGEYNHIRILQWNHLRFRTGVVPTQKKMRSTAFVFADMKTGKNSFLTRSWDQNSTGHRKVSKTKWVKSDWHERAGGCNSADFHTGEITWVRFCWGGYKGLAEGYPLRTIKLVPIPDAERYACYLVIEGQDELLWATAKELVLESRMQMAWCHRMLFFLMAQTMDDEEYTKQKVISTLGRHFEL